MRVLFRSNVVRFASAKVRLLLKLSVLLPVALGPLNTEAILIHYHYGHDVHSHSLTLNDLDDWHCDPEHQHEKHEHDGQPAGPPEGDSGTIVIVLDLPDALLRVRGLSMATAAVAGPAPTPRAITVTVDADTCKNPSLYKRPWTLAPSPRADRIVANILLSNHALLL